LVAQLYVHFALIVIDRYTNYMYTILLILTLVVIQFYFAFACVSEAKRKGRLNNWWVLFAGLIPIVPYFVMRRLHPKKVTGKSSDSGSD